MDKYIYRYKHTQNCISTEAEHEYSNGHLKYVFIQANYWHVDETSLWNDEIEADTPILIMNAYTYHTRLFY